MGKYRHILPQKDFLQCTDNGHQFFTVLACLLCSEGKAQSIINPNMTYLNSFIFFLNRRRKLLAAKDVQASHFANGAMKLIGRACVVA